MGLLNNGVFRRNLKDRHFANYSTVPEWIYPDLMNGIAQCPADFGAIAAHSAAIYRAEPVG
jgi:hypothetical protein